MSRFNIIASILCFSMLIGAATAFAQDSPHIVVGHLRVVRPEGWHDEQVERISVITNDSTGFTTIGFTFYDSMPPDSVFSEKLAVIYGADLQEFVLFTKNCTLETENGDYLRYFGTAELKGKLVLVAIDIASFSLNSCIFISIGSLDEWSQSASPYETMLSTLEYMGGA